MMKKALLVAFAGVAEASHCLGGSPPDYCCIIACDSSYANKAGYYGPGTTPPCGPGQQTLANVFAIASSRGCGPLTEDSCAFGPTIFGRGTCSPEVSVPEVYASGDPHLNLPHGGKADFRGEDKTFYNFLSAKNLALNVMTEMADFELHPSDSPMHKDVHGSFLTQAHVVARSSTGKIVRVSFYAEKIGDNHVGWANGTVDSEPAFKIGGKTSKTVDDISMSIDYSALRVVVPEFEIIVTPKKFRLERNVVGMHHRLDIEIKKRVDEDKFAVPPHGIVGQGWDGDAKAIDGEQDSFPASGEFTTYAMAKGAIEGTPNDYKVADKYATAFKFSRFDATTAEPRKVAELVASGNLNPPKKVLTATGDSVGASEYDFSNI